MPQRPKIVVVGNAKGGSGKSTTVMHMATRLLCQGHRVALIDLDGRQQTLGRYVQNRAALQAEQPGLVLPMPHLQVVHEETLQQASQRQRALSDAIEVALRHGDIVLVDCPGHDTYLTRVAHGLADLIVTPLNDSFVDLDVLARVAPRTFKILAPSWYAEMVFAQRKKRLMESGQSIDWLVVRNRVSHSAVRNKRHMQAALAALAGPFGFVAAQGLGERVIFRELFVYGLTLSDLPTCHKVVPMSMAHVAAHQEVRDLVRLLPKLPVGVAATQTDVRRAAS